MSETFQQGSETLQTISKPACLQKLSAFVKENHQRKLLCKRRAHPEVWGNTGVLGKIKKQLNEFLVK